MRVSPRFPSDDLIGDGRMSDHDAARPTLLVVDDEPDILDAIQRLFRKQYQVLTAQSVDQAWEVLAEHAPQVVLADQRLPRQTGVEFFCALRESHPELVRVLFTGYTNIDSVIDAINEGHVYRYISKPWKPAELRLFIEQAFEHYHARRERERLAAELARANAELEARNASLEQANAQLRTLDRVRSVFMEVVSHELNTPIAIITGYTYLLRRELEPLLNPVATKSLERIDASALRLRRISDRIFQMISEESPNNRLHTQAVNLRELAVSLHEQLEPFLEKRRQRLLSTIDQSLESIEADPDKLQDILTHLLMNAIKFSRDGETIQLNAKPDPVHHDMILLQVRDNGVGISEDDRDQVFSAFFSTFKTGNHSSGDYEFNKRGIGLGLSVARKFVEMHGGTIQVESEEGRGALFTIRLPRRGPNALTR